jgi:hypothetical protein
MRNRLVTVAICALFAGSASAAVTVSTTSSGTTPAFDPGYSGLGLIHDFEGPLFSGALSGDFKIETAPGTGIAAAPAGTTPGTRFLTVPNSMSSGSATLKLGGNYKLVSLYWGSIDDYNTLELLDEVGNVLHSVTGAALPTPVAANGNQSASASNRRVLFTNDIANIAALRLSSTNYAFEIDSVAVAVPEPATWAMMLGGFGLLGAAARRRGSAKTVTA